MYKDLKTGDKPTDRQLVVLKAYTKTSSIRETSKMTGEARSSIGWIIKRFGIQVDVSHGRIGAPTVIVRPKPKKGVVKTYLVTSIQNNTKLHTGLWNNMLAYAKFRDAEILVSRFVYRRGAYKGNEKSSSQHASEKEGVWYDERVSDYICDDPVRLASGLVFWGNMNTLPTAANPTSKFVSHGGTQSGIFPHTRQEQRPVATMKGTDAKNLYTTGTISQRNYIQKAAGIMADFYHIYGCLVVEVDSSGTWWVRQVNSSQDGSFQDVDVLVKKSVVYDRQEVLSINPGDIHAYEIDKTVQKAIWGDDGVVDLLKPKYQFLHDLLSMHHRNHHDMKNPHRMFEKYTNGEDCVLSEVRDTARLVKEISRKVPNTIVVRSNHDCAFEKWLNDNPMAYTTDFVNAVYFLKAQTAKYEAIAAKNTSFLSLEWAFWKEGNLDHIQFLQEDESFILKKVQFGMHGHLGPNGARGSPAGLARIGEKANTGHTHSPGIFGGLVCSGTTSRLDLKYVKGPSSWSHTLSAMYPSGKRTLMQVKKGLAYAYREDRKINVNKANKKVKK